MLIIGFALMALSMFSTGLFLLADKHALQIISVLIFLSGFSISMGPVFWAYLPEVLNSNAIILCSAAVWFTTTTVSVVVPSLQNYKVFMM